VATLALTRSTSGAAPEASVLPYDERWLTRLAEGIVVDRTETTPTVEGLLPPELSGTLYRNGQGYSSAIIIGNPRSSTATE